MSEAVSLSVEIVPEPSEVFDLRFSINNIYDFRSTQTQLVIHHQLI